MAYNSARHPYRYLSTRRSSRFKRFSISPAATLVGIISIVCMLFAFQVWAVSPAKPVSAAESDTLTLDLLRLINEERTKQNLNTLVLQPQLSRAAQSKVEDMVKEDYFAHNSPAGVKWSDFIDREGYDYRYAGENLAKGYTGSETTVQAWMNSQTHRDNILNPNYRDTGFGLTYRVIGDTKTLYISNMFGILN